MSNRRIISDAAWQIMGRVISAMAGFVVILLISPYLGDLRYGDYTTVLSFFVICSSLSDYGLYVIAIRELGKHKDDPVESQRLYGTYVGTRLLLVCVIYTIALAIGFMIPAYRTNPYIARGLPIAMLFSATFMLKGVMQLPLQVNRQMHQTSLGLIIGRVAQLIGLLLVVFVFFPHRGDDPVSLAMFVGVLLTVLVSGLVEWLYISGMAARFIPLRVRLDWSFIRRFLRTNASYGLAYFMSSFHTYVVAFLLSLYYPTVDGNTHTARRGLGLQLMVILLIIPTFLGNSMLHHIADNEPQKKQQQYGALMGLSLWVGALVVLMMRLFAPMLVSFINHELLSTSTQLGADAVLRGLSIVLYLSYIKQVLNYTLVGSNYERHIFWINLVGLITGIVTGVVLIPQTGWRGGIVGGLVAQGVLELMFVIGGVVAAVRTGCAPRLRRGRVVVSIGIAALLGRGTTVLLERYLMRPLLYDGWRSIMLAGGVGLTVLVVYGLLTRSQLRRTLREL